MSKTNGKSTRMDHAQLLEYRRRDVKRRHIPNLGATVLEKLKKLWNHNIKGSVESVAIQELSRIFADLL